MSKHDPDGLPQGSKWGVCSECGYRITDRDEVVCNTEEMEFIHERCIPDEQN